MVPLCDSFPDSLHNSLIFFGRPNYPAFYQLKFRSYSRPKLLHRGLVFGDTLDCVCSFRVLANEVIFAWNRMENGREMGTKSGPCCKETWCGQDIKSAPRRLRTRNKTHYWQSQWTTWYPWAISRPPFPSMRNDVGSHQIQDRSTLYNDGGLKLIWVFATTYEQSRLNLSTERHTLGHSDLAGHHERSSVV